MAAAKEYRSVAKMAFVLVEQKAAQWESDWVEHWAGPKDIAKVCRTDEKMVAV